MVTPKPSDIGRRVILQPDGIECTLADIARRHGPDSELGVMVEMDEGMVCWSTFGNVSFVENDQ